MLDTLERSKLKHEDEEEKGVIERWGEVQFSEKVDKCKYDELNCTNLSSHQPLVLSVSALTEILEAGTVPLSIRPTAIA